MVREAYDTPAMSLDQVPRQLGSVGYLLRETVIVNSDTSYENRELAQRLLSEWQAGKPKSRIERETWNDGRSHGRHFDRFIFENLGVRTVQKSKLSDRVAELETQIRSLGAVPRGAVEHSWERQLQHARESCTAALRIWNDPAASFRTGAFSLLIVTACNALCIAILQKREEEWKAVNTDSDGFNAGTDRALGTVELLNKAFPDASQHGLRENLKLWINLRNAVAHRCLEALDHCMIPQAQAAVLNFENVVRDEFGSEFGLGEHLSVPLQLSGFRDPGVLASRKKLQASLPPDVQHLLAQPELEHPELLADSTFSLRIAFIPMVSATTNNPDAIAYFAKPGEVPEDVEKSIGKFLVIPKAYTKRPELRAMQVIKIVQDRI